MTRTHWLERGRAEVWILLTTALVLGFAFLWGLVLHEKPERRRNDAQTAEQVAATTPGPTVPATNPPPRTYETVGKVNIRQGPATNTTVIGQIPGKTAVVVECRTTGESVTSSAGNSDQWLQIQTPAGPGYVSALYVDVGDDLDKRNRLGVCAVR